MKTTASSLTEFEALLAGYAVSTITGSAGDSSELLARLVDLDIPQWLLNSVRIGAGRWSVCDDDRLDVIVHHAAQISRALGGAEEDRLRAVGLTDFDIIDLNNVVTYYNR